MTLEHPARTTRSGLRLYSRRLVLRPLVAQDFEQWSAVRLRNVEWLTKWEPLRQPYHPDPERDRDVFAARCSLRERERQSGTQYAFGIFLDGKFVGEININNVVRGSLQAGTIGYWIDQAHAGHAYMSEAVVSLLRYAFDELQLHRIEVCIIPRNRNSHRVVDKIGLRNEGVALRFLEINGVWEDHVRYAMTAEEWRARAADLTTTWLGAAR